MDEFVALSVLALDLDVPAGGWSAFLGVRGIPIRADDLGRSAITREAARRLLEEKRANELKQAARRRLQEQEAVEQDRAWRS
jgi:uncharacterized membrane protein